MPETIMRHLVWESECEPGESVRDAAYRFAGNLSHDEDTAVWWCEPRPGPFRVQGFRPRYECETTGGRWQVYQLD